ncbi:MAG TPA: glycosyltransferase family 4 protein [Thermoplasmata archaeon]|nr:glycosyltransferase family 4 protein [Thermoplasmata archaeon]
MAQGPLRRVLFTGAAVGPGFGGGEPVLADLLEREFRRAGIEVGRDGKPRTLLGLAGLAVTPFDVQPGRVREYRRTVRRFRPEAVLAFVDYDCSAAVAARLERVPVAVCIQIYWPTCPVGTHYIEGEGVCFTPELVKCVRHISRAPISPNLQLPVPNLPAPLALMLYLKLLERPAALSQADALIANSSFTAGVLRNAGYERVHIIHNAVDTELFRAFPWEGPRKAVLYPVARSHQERKGHPHFVELARRIRAETPEVAFRILNDPGDALCEGTPYLTHEELARELRSDYLVVVPSLWDEPIPFVAIEAMSAGRPVVAYRVGGMPDLIEDGVSGRLVPRGDLDQLTRVVRELLNDEDAARRMGQAARERVERGFDCRTMADRYLALLSSLRASA